MVKRRGAGEGSIYQTVDGRWNAMLDLGWEDGKRKRRRLSARTRNEVLAKMREALRAAEQGVQADAYMTVEKWLNHWLATVVNGRVGSENTSLNYSTIVRIHLIPGLGKVKLDKLTAEQVDRFLAGKADAGLSKSYIGRMRTLLSDALKHAERRGLVPRNVAALSVMPRTKAPEERRSLTPDEARRLLVAARGEERGGEWHPERLEALVVVGLVAGFRPGELAAIRWQDTDLDAHPPTVAISGSLKRTPGKNGKGYVLSLGAVKRSAAGNRTVSLPPVAVEALRAHKARQAAERLKAGDLWRDHGLVFCTEVGTPLDPSNLRRIFARIAERAGLDVRFPYLLRHTAASLLLDAGASIEEVADLLGDDPRTLYRHYRHKVRPVADAATRMEAVLGASMVATETA